MKKFEYFWYKCTIIMDYLLKLFFFFYWYRKQEAGNTSNPPANKKPLISLRKDIIDKRYLDIVA